MIQQINLLIINDKSRETYNVSSDIKFKTSLIRSNLCGYRDIYIQVKGTITVPNIAATINNTNKKVIFKNCAPIADSISE